METTTFLQRFTDKAVWITLIAVFVMGILADHYVLNPGPKYGYDTTMVQAKPPSAQVTTGINAVIPPPTIVYRDRIRTDSTALWESAWLQNETATLNDKVDTLISQRDSLKQRLDKLLAPHTAVTPFHFTLLNGTGYLNGTAEQAYLPLKEQFGLSLVPTELYLPQVTITRKSAAWVKPLIFLSGAYAGYELDKNHTGTLIGLTVGSFFTLVEF